MRIETICENRKELVKAMAEILGEPSKYLGPPSFGYQIGGAIVDRDGNIETEDGEMLQKELQRRGFIENNQEELNLQIPIEGHTAESIRNLIFMIHSKQYLLEHILSSRMNTGKMEQYLAVIANNSSKGIYLEDGTLVGHLLPAIDSRLGQAQKLNRRLSL